MSDVSGAAKTHQAISFDEADIVAIKAVTDQLLLFASSEGTLTADGTEQDVYIDDAPAGVNAPRVVFIDLDNMAGGDTVVISVYYRVVTAGAQKLYDTTSYVGADGGLADSRKIIGVELLPNRNGVQVTLEQTAGVNRDYPWNAIVED